MKIIIFKTIPKNIAPNLCSYNSYKTGIFVYIEYTPNLEVISLYYLFTKY